MARLNEADARWRTITRGGAAGQANFAKQGQGLQRWARRKAEREQAAAARRSAKKARA